MLQLLPGSKFEEMELLVYYKLLPVHLANDFHSNFLQQNASSRRTFSSLLSNGFHFYEEDFFKFSRKFSSNVLATSCKNFIGCIFNFLGVVKKYKRDAMRSRLIRVAKHNFSTEKILSGVSNHVWKISFF